MKKPFITLKNTYALLLIIFISNCATETEGLALMTNSFKKRAEDKFTELDKKDKEHDGELITQKAENNKKYSLLQEKNNILEKQLKETKEEFEKKIKEEIEDVNSENNKTIISLREEKLQLKHTLDTTQANLNNTHIILEEKEKELNSKKTTLDACENNLKKKQEELKSNEENLTKTLADKENEKQAIIEELQTLKTEKINKEKIEKINKEKINKEKIEKINKEKINKEKIEKEIKRIEKIKTDLIHSIPQVKHKSQYGCMRFLVINYLFEILQKLITESDDADNSKLKILEDLFIFINNKKFKDKYFDFDLSNDLLSDLFEFDDTVVKKNNKEPKTTDNNYLAKHILYNIYCLVLCTQNTKNKDGTKSIKIEKTDENSQKYKVSLIDKTA